MSSTKHLTKGLKPHKKRVQHPRLPARPGPGAAAAGRGTPHPVTDTAVLRRRDTGERKRTGKSLLLLLPPLKIKKPLGGGGREPVSILPSRLAGRGYVTAPSSAHPHRAGPGRPNRGGRRRRRPGADRRATAPPAASPPRRPSPTVRQLHGAGTAQGPRQPVELLHGSLHPRGAQPGAADTPPAAASPLSPSRRRRRGCSPGRCRPPTTCTCSEAGRLRACAVGEAGRREARAARRPRP